VDKIGLNNVVERAHLVKISDLKHNGSWIKHQRRLDQDINSMKSIRPTWQDIDVGTLELINTAAIHGNGGVYTSS